MPYNEDKALAYATEAARKGYLAAQANVMAFYMALGRTDEARDEEHMSWLFAGVAWGSFVAAACLRRLSPSTADDARDAFHHAGGYNQFFYPREPPSYIHSAEFAGSLSSQQADLSALAQAAAVYGDATLLSRLFALGVSPNLTNLEGESLLLLCCKGGHLEVLKVSIGLEWKTAGETNNCRFS